MGHAGHADELLEIVGDELPSVIRDESGLFLGVLFQRPLQDALDIHLGQPRCCICAQMARNDAP